MKPSAGDGFLGMGLMGQVISAGTTDIHRYPQEAIYRRCLPYARSMQGVCKGICPENMDRNMVRLRSSIESDPEDLPLNRLKCLCLV